MCPTNTALQCLPARRVFGGADGQGHCTDPAWPCWLLPSVLTTTLPGHPKCCQCAPSAARAPQMLPVQPKCCHTASAAPPVLPRDCKDENLPMVTVILLPLERSSWASFTGSWASSS